MNFKRHTIIALLALATLSSVSNAAVQRSASQESYSPLIILTVTPPALTAAYAVEETLDGDALPTQITQNGAYDPATGKIKWGPFIDGESRTLSYRVSGPAGSLALSGKASFDGTTETIGNASLTLPDPNTTFYGYQYQNLTERDFIQFPLDTNSDTDGDGISDFNRYAFAMIGSNLSLQIDTFQAATVRAYVSNQSADTNYTLEASTNLSDWEPITDRLPSVTLTSRYASTVVGADELLYSAVPLDSDEPLIIRLRATWLAAPIE